MVQTAHASRATTIPVSSRLHLGLSISNLLFVPVKSMALDPQQKYQLVQRVVKKQAKSHTNLAGWE